MVEKDLFLQGMDFRVLLDSSLWGKFNSSINLDTCLRCRYELQDDILTRLSGLLLGMRCQRFGTLIIIFCRDIDIQEISFI